MDQATSTSGLSSLRCRHFAAWLGLYLVAATSGVAARYSIEVWDTDSKVRLPQNSVIAMTQSRDGYLWLGTVNGLARFDGFRFKIFNEGNTPGLRSSPIVKLIEDSQHNLWIGTETEGVLLVKDGRVQSLDIGQRRREGRLIAIAEDAQQSVWLYTADGQLARYARGKVDVWEWDAPAGGGQPRALAVDNSGLLWIASDRGLSTRRLTADLKPGEFPPAVREAIVPGGLDFLCASRAGGVWCLANGRILRSDGETFKEFVAFPWKPGVPVNAACEDQHGNLIVGTGGAGVFWFDANGGFQQLTNGPAGLSYDIILALHMDVTGCLWVGTDGGGLNRVQEALFEVVEASRDLPVQSVSEDASGGVWIGYNRDRVDYWRNGAVEKEYSRWDGLLGLVVRSVLADRDQRVWAGTFGGGLLRLQDNLFMQAPGAEFLSRQSEVSALFQDRGGSIWVGTHGGLARWDGSEWRVVTNGLNAQAVRALAEDAQGGLWLGTVGSGLARLSQGRVDWFGKTNGLPSNTIRALLADASGALWAGTSSGLAEYRSGKWISYGNHPDLAGASIGYLLEDTLGYLWLGSNVGLKRVRKQLLQEWIPGSPDAPLVRSYGKSDGLPSAECSQGSQPAACRAGDGRCYFPTIKGLAFVDPARLRQNTNAPLVLIESVTIDGQLRAASGLGVPAPTAVTLPADKESLEIGYSSLDLSAADRGRFKYRLRGHENIWTERSGDIRYASYSKLPDGHYVFELRACNEDGVWSRSAATLAVTVLPPFWRTWWFLTTAAVCLLGAVAGSVHYVSTQKLQRQLAALRQQEALETERARIARDLHDQLGANLTQVALLSEMAEADKNLPGEVEGHARQIAHTARETTRALDEIVWTVNPSNDTLEGLLNYVCKYTQEYLALAGLRYRLEVPPQLPPLRISPELRHHLFLAAKEAVNNVVKHSQASAAWLRLRIEPDGFSLEIEDNGRGLADADHAKGRNGLRNMRKRMEELGGQFEIGPGAKGGTRVRLTALLGTRPKTP